MPMFRSSNRAASPAMTNRNTNNEVLLTYKSQKLTAQPPTVSTPVSSPTAKPQRRQPSPTKTRRDPIDTLREQDTRDAPPPSSTHVSSSIPSPRTTATRPTTTSPPKRPKKRIITPQMVKRRNINAKNPLVMKSDESHAGKDSVVTEQTEKASNKKDAKRRQRGYEKFGGAATGGGSSRERKSMEGGRGMEIRKRMEKDLPPLSIKKLATVQDGRENDSSIGNTKTEKRAVKKQMDDEKDSVIKPNEYEEDALLLKKRVPSSSGQSCSAFFLGDASSASPVGDAKKDDREVLSPRPVPPKRSSTVGNKVSQSNSPSMKKQMSKLTSPRTSRVKSNKPDASSSGNERKIESDVTKSTASLLGNDETKKSTSSSADDDPKTSPSALSALKSQLLSLSSQGKSSKQEVETDLASPTFDDQPIDSAPTVEDLTEPNVIEQKEAVTLEKQPTVETIVADANEGNNDRDANPNLADKEVDRQTEQADKLNPAVNSDKQTLDKSASASGHIANKGSLDNASPDGETGTNTPQRAQGGKKKQLTMTSFLGKQSKVIDEGAEYVEDEKKLAEEFNGDRYAGLEEQASDEIMDLHLQATLSDCEYSSVQSSVTTDKILEAQPSIIKRTSSLIRNPLLRRNRSKKKSDMDELVECMKRGKLAAKADNDHEEFDDKPSRGRKTLKRGQFGVDHKRRASSRSRRSELTDDDNESTASASSDQPDSEDVEEMYDATTKRPGKKNVSLPDSAENSSQYLTSKGTFDGGSMTKRLGGGIPNVDPSVKVEMKSPSFRMSAVSGTGAGLQSPLAQQIMLNALNERSNSSTRLQSGQTDIKGAISNTYSIDHGTQTSATSPQNITYQSSYKTASASSFGTFGDVVETIGLFSARICLGTGAAIVSCSRACNDNPKSDVKEVRLDSNSFIEPNVDMFSSPRNNVSVLSPIGTMSPRNDIFREGPRSPNSAHNDHTLALADAISQMPEEEQINLVRQLSSKSHSMVSPRSADMDMMSSVDGMFGHHGMSRRIKKVPHNIALKPNQHRAYQDIVVEQQVSNDRDESKQAQGKKPLKGFRKGLKRLAKTRLAVMYQV